ncbi:MAG: VWA domain-containing protein [Helicobacteraceae bacterium]|jgi:Mg-chelatase subunit ChlD|nr:VWA domain-containing protein [Helicobacteraceae bacterium]
MKNGAKTFLAALAAAFLAFAFKAQAVDYVGTNAPKTRVEVVFVLDTTGSMSNLIDGAKRKIWSIANSIIDQNPNAYVRVGLAGYRDVGDDYIVRYYPLTDDMQGIYQKLLAFDANGGGDTPESVNEALDVAVTKMGWSAADKKTIRVIFLVGDAPPHMDYKQDRKYQEVVAEARQRGIIVNAVQAGDLSSTQKIWREIARLGGGDYIAIPQDGGRVIVIETPYDEEIIVIQRKLNSTAIIYGHAKQQEIAQNRLDSYASAPQSIAAETSKFVNKNSAGRGVITGGGDLIEDVSVGAKKLKDVPVKELPENMQNMSAKQREAFVAEQIKLRDALTKELAAALAKRDAFIAKAASEKEPSGDSFDRAVARTLKKQVKE